MRQCLRHRRGPQVRRFRGGWGRRWCATTTATTTSSTDKRNVIITTPMYYVNGDPHVGHCHSSVLADVLCRHHRLLMGRNACLISGTDEHGSKVSRSAHDANESPADWCERVSANFERMSHALHVHPDVWVRTSAPTHEQTVDQLWGRLRAHEALVSTSYSGYYSEPDEEFVAEDDTYVDKDGCRRSKHSDALVLFVSEKGFAIDTPKMRSLLRDWLSRTPSPVQPSHALQEVMQWVEGAEGMQLEPVMITRPSERVQWAIKVPNDDHQTFYVWFDALASYLTPSHVPRDSAHTIHVIGKDILRFHTVLWPCMLHMGGHALPDAVIAHSHWTVNGVKMSKRLGNVVNPLAVLQNGVSADALRYYMMREPSPTKDCDFSPERLRARVNGDLCNVLGNMLKRCSSSALNAQQCWPRAPPSLCGSQEADERLRDLFAALPGQWVACMEGSDPQAALEHVMSALRALNVWFQECALWTLKGQQHDHRRADVLWMSLNCLRISCTLLHCVIPTAAEEALKAMSVTTRSIDDCEWSSCAPEGASVHALSQLTLFPKVPPLTHAQLTQVCNEL